MRLAVAADHAGYDLKEKVAAALRDNGHEVQDLGAHDLTPVDYPDYAEKVAAALVERRAERAILLCGSGVGVSVVANKVPGIRAGLCHDTYSAHQGVEHDDMNVLCIGARVVGEMLAVDIVQAFVTARFLREGRHRRRLDKLLAVETKHLRVPFVRKEETT